MGTVGIINEDKINLFYGANHMQLNDAINSFLTDSRYLSPKTIQRYHYVLRNFEMFMETRWRDKGIFEGSIYLITRNDLEVFLYSPVKPLEASTYNSYLSIFNRLFKYLVNQGFWGISPSRNIRRRKEARPAPSFLTVDEQNLLLGMALSNKRNGFRDFLMIYLILNTGRRLSEILAVNISDINFKDEVVILNITGRGLTLCEGSEEFQTRLGNYLEECRSQCKHKDDVPLFLVMSGPNKGQRMNVEAAQDKIWTIFRKCELRGRAIQCLRQTAISIMSDMGLNPYEIMYLLGNNNFLLVSRKLFEYDYWKRTKKFHVN